MQGKPVKIALLDSNSNEQNILYKDEFDEWANINQNLMIVYTITGEERSSPPAGEWKGERGRMDKSMSAKYLTKEERTEAEGYSWFRPGRARCTGWLSW